MGSDVLETEEFRNWMRMLLSHNPEDTLLALAMGEEFKDNPEVIKLLPRMWWTSSPNKDIRFHIESFLDIGHGAEAYASPYISAYAHIETSCDHRAVLHYRKKYLE